MSHDGKDDDFKTNVSRTVCGLSLTDLFTSDKFKQFRTFLDQAIDKTYAEGFEYGGVAYINAKNGDVKYAGPKTAKTAADDTADLQSMVKVPDGYTQILLAYHAHPTPESVPSTAPSGITDGKGDVSKARSAPWNQAFFFVATGIKDPKKPRVTTGICEVVAIRTTAKGNKYRVWYVEPK